MNSRGNVVFGFAMLCAILLMAGGLLYLGVNVFIIFDKNVSSASAIVAATATILVSVVSVVYGRHLEARTIVLKELREKKAPVYDEIIAFLTKTMKSAKWPQDISDEELSVAFLSLSPRLMIWAGDDVVRHWAEFREMSQAAGEHGKVKEMVLAYANLVLAIRRDLGHANKSISSNTILNVFFNDVNAILKESEVATS